MVYVWLIIALVFFAGAFYYGRKRPSVDSIISDIDAKVNQLGVVAALHHDEAVVHNEVIAKAQSLRALALREKDRALAIAERFKALIAP